ncbi:acetyltransferase [Agromyces badenianii]|uniref:Acetyltransferase n=1 Tax=Agromyces badenianii TaxID=2080742 RepID=A0A2S0X005_9MICO|nr:acetyltransferase [Agromyces badenianii]AWB96949.1 acetyltransferase [Agromyces badenianii]
MLHVVVVGAGGFGREVLDVLEALNEGSPAARYVVDGVIDDSPSELNLSRLADRGYRYLGSLDEYLARGGAARYVIGIGAPQIRARVVMKIGDRLSPIDPIVHPKANFGSRVTLGAGSVVCAGVSMTTNISSGDHVHVNPNVSVGHDSMLGDYVSLNPGCAISGDVVIGDRVLVGTTAAILQGLTIGADAVVGAVACVTRDVAVGQTVIGVPARPQQPAAAPVPEPQSTSQTPDRRR